VKQKVIEELLERYGLDRMLEDNYISLSEALQLLEDLGYINLEMYVDDEQQ